MPDGIADDCQHRDAEGEIALRGLKQIGPADVGDAVRAVRQPDRVDHDQRDDLLERDRHHREVMAAEPQRRHAEERPRPQRDDATRDETEPVAHVQVGGSDADGIGAEAEERRLRQIDLAAQAEHDGQAEHRDRKRRRLHQDVEDIAVEPHHGGHGHQDRRGDEIGQMAQQQRSGPHRRCHRHVVAGRAHAFSATRSPKIPCGRKIRNSTSTRKAKAILVRH